MQVARARWRNALEAFWVVPAGSIATAIAGGLALPALDGAVTVPDGIAFSGNEDTARAVLGAIVAIGVSVAGVSFSVIAVALVLASQQLSPRVLRSFQRQRLNQAVLAMLLGSATYALFVLGSIGEERERPVPELSVTLAMVLAAAALGLFTVFLHHVVRSLNASVVIRRIAADGHVAIEAPYPDGVGRQPADPAAAERRVQERRDSWRCAEVHAPRAGYVAFVDGRKIVRWAAEHDALVEQRRGVGDFGVTGSVLALVYHQDGGDLDCTPVADAFRLQEERVVEGDVAFPIRQLADIALKGLSPGINDPTTAENAMDSVTDTLVRFAQRDEVSALRLDDDDVPRLVAIGPTLDELVRLGFDQVRRDAAKRPSFAVRLLQLLADLRESSTACRDCTEIDRQADLIAQQSADLAEHDADQRMVAAAYERLHVHT